VKALSAALALTVGTAVAATAAPAAASTHPAAQQHEVRAVVVVRPGVALPLGVAGGRVVTVLPHVGAEVVSATPAALLALAHDSRVLGMTPDRRGHVASVDKASAGKTGAAAKTAAAQAPGVLASTYLGGSAGKQGTGRHVNVALLDTGVSDTAALSRSSGRITDGVDVSQLASGGPALTQGRFTDGYGHGTFLASLIAGGKVAGSGSRALGVAPSARIVVVKVADDSGNTSLSQVLAGMDWVAAHARAIQVVNLALAVDRPTAPAYGADPLTAAVEHVRAAGVVVVAAAGNKADEVGDPGYDPQALTVGAADVSSGSPTVAPFSGSGVVDGVSKPDVVAPGVHVLGMINADSRIATTQPEGWAAHGLFKGSGTSEATAVTSGVVAAYLSLHPHASVVQVKSALRANAQRVHSKRGGRGLVRMTAGVVPHASLKTAGESGWNQKAWNDNAWSGLPDWQTHLASMWSGPAWNAVTWSAVTWSAVTWSNSAWSAVTWSAVSWSAVTWSAVTWSAVTWSAVSWSAVTWSAVTWSAVSWSDYGWGDT
jgi:serine protease AprX